MKGTDCEILPHEYFLGENPYTLWDCYSEHGSNFNNRLHFHDFYEMSVIYEGSSDFLVNGTSLHMGERSVQLIRPCDYHRQQTGEREHIRYYNLMFTDGMLTDGLRDLLDRDDLPLYAILDGEVWRDLLALMSRCHEMAQKDPYGELTMQFIRGAIGIFCVFLLEGSAKSPPVPEDGPQECVRRAVGYVRRHYREKIRLRDAADAAGLSENYFSTLFRSVMGVTFSEYLCGYRLKIADGYLRAGDLSIKEIAPLCGFPSAEYFVTKYRLRYGVTPGKKGKSVP